VVNLKIMAYDEYLAERLAMSFNRRHVAFVAKKMMGGILFMVDDKMCIGLNRDKNTNEDRIKVQVGEFAQDLCMKRAGCRPMMGFINVNPSGLIWTKTRGLWVEKALEYNPMSKRSKI